MMRRLTLIALVATALLAPNLSQAEEGLTPEQQFGPSVPAATLGCTSTFSDSPRFVTFGSIGGEPITGHLVRQSMFSVSNRTLVVFFHGYSHLSDSWKPHLAEAARRGMTALAVDYRGHRTIAGFDRGWEVFKGAEDGIHAANQMLANCPGQFDKVVAFGVSMGGNASGLAVATAGSPFTHWFDVEGVTNLVEISTAARALAPSSTFIGNADADIEAALGGRLEENPSGYAAGTVALRAADIKATNLKGAFIIHGVEDGLAPFNMALEMKAALAGVRIPTETYAVVTRGSSESGTVLSGYAADPLGDALGLGYESPFAGHASEASTTHRVMRTALDRLATFAQGTVPHLGTSFVPVP